LTNWYWQKVGPTESLWLFGEVNFNLVWFCIAGIIWASGWGVQIGNMIYSIIIIVSIGFAAFAMWITGITFGVKRMAFFSPLILALLLIYEQAKMLYQGWKDTIHPG
jgi:hypothetical protein